MNRFHALCCGLIAAALIAPTLESAQANILSAPLAVTRIAAGTMAGDDPTAHEFSVAIEFEASQAVSSGWRLGFYMPRTFVALGTVNPRLEMTVCDDARRCAALVYTVSKAPEQLDRAAGYLTQLEAATPYALQPGRHYTVNLLHNNNYNVGSYGDLPQNLFLIAVNGRASHLPTTASQYVLLDYRPDVVATQIAQHIATVWNESAPPPAVSAPIVPTPSHYVASAGRFDLKQHDLTIYDGTYGGPKNDAHATAQLLAQWLESDLGVHATIKSGYGATGILLVSSPVMDPEGYNLLIRPTTIQIGAASPAGFFYAIQTLRQLWQAAPDVAAANIADAPRFRYRGLLLDVARHYYPPEEIRRLIDLMAAHKLNTLHLHLSDDEGFRVALDAFPQLAQFGAFRGLTTRLAPSPLIQSELDFTPGGTRPYSDGLRPEGGYYTVSDLRKLVDYANAHMITIIPEIDWPGHARALIKALPGDFVDPLDRSRFAAVQGYTDDVIPVCAYHDDPTAFGKRFTQTANTLIEEIAAPFAHQTTITALPVEISLGADEVSLNAWSADSRCQGDWAGLSATGKAHRFFGLLFAQHPELKFSGWQELVMDGRTVGTLPPDRVGHVWVWSPTAEGVADAQVLARAGYPTVLAFADQTYFDLAYTPDAHEPGLYWATPFSDTAAALAAGKSATLVGAALDAAARAHLMGLEGALWGDMIPSYDRMIYMAEPKMAGLAQAAWSADSGGKQLGWRDLAARLGDGQHGFLAYLDKRFGVHYRGWPQGIRREIPENAAPK